MKTYKVVKIWYLEAENDQEALKLSCKQAPEFTKANSEFKVDLRKKEGSQ